jgi:hypothetical protein
MRDTWQMSTFTSILLRRADDMANICPRSNALQMENGSKAKASGKKVNKYLSEFGTKVEAGYEALAGRLEEEEAQL